MEQIIYGVCFSFGKKEDAIVTVICKVGLGVLRSVRTSLCLYDTKKKKLLRFIERRICNIELDNQRLVLDLVVLFSSKLEIESPSHPVI